MRSAGSQSLEEQASCSQGNSQAAFIFDTISKRSEMITTNGGVNIHLQQRASAPKPEIVATHVCQCQTAVLMAPWCSEGGQGGLVWDSPFLPNNFVIRIL